MFVYLMSNHVMCIYSGLICDASRVAFFWSFKFLRLHHKFRCPILGYRIDGLSLIMYFVIFGFEFRNFRDSRLENAMCGLRLDILYSVHRKSTKTPGMRCVSRCVFRLFFVMILDGATVHCILMSDFGVSNRRFGPVFSCRKSFPFFVIRHCFY